VLYSLLYWSIAGYDVNECGKDKVSSLSVKSRAVIACDIGRRIYMESFYRLHNIWGLLKISLILVNRNYVLGNL